MEKCPIISKARKKAEDEGILLNSISGIPIDEEIFKKPKDAVPKPAKIPGFVISSTVDINDPYSAPSAKQQKMGIRTGKKGYVRCVSCNTEVYAPNAKHHAANCKKRYLGTGISRYDSKGQSSSSAKKWAATISLCIQGLNTRHSLFLAQWPFGFCSKVHSSSQAPTCQCHLSNFL